MAIFWTIAREWIGRDSGKSLQEEALRRLESAITHTSKLMAESRPILWEKIEAWNVF